MHQVPESVLWYERGRKGGFESFTPQECYYKAIFLPDFYTDSNRVLFTFYSLGVCGGHKEYTERKCYEEALKVYKYISTEDSNNDVGLQKWLCTESSDTSFFMEHYYARKIHHMAIMGEGWLFDRIKCDSNTCYHFLNTIKDPSTQIVYCVHRGWIFYYAESKVRRGYEVQKNVTNPKSWFKLSRVGGGRVFDEDYSAIECLEYAIRINPRNYKYWYNLGYLGGSPKYEQRDCFTKAIEVSKGHWKSGKAYIWLAKLEDNDLCKKRQYLKKSLEIWPNNRMALNNLKNWEWCC